MTAEFTTQADSKTAGRKGASETVSNLQEGVRDYLVRGKERAIEMEEGLESYVQDHPIRSILIAAGVGVVVGAIISRR